MELTSEGNRSRVFSWNVGLLVTSGAAWIAAAGTLPSRLGAALDLDRLPSLRAAMLVGAGGTALSFLCFALLGVGWNRRAPEPRAAVRPIGRGPAGFLTDWRAPLGLALVVALWMTGPALVAPFFNLFFSRVHGLSVERVGGVLAVAQLVAGAAVFAGGELAARVGPRRALACWVFGFAPLLWALAVAPAGAAVAIFLALGIVSPASNALIDQLVMEQATPDRRGVLSSWRNAATDASGAAGASLGGAVLGAWSFPVLFGWAAVVGLAGGAALLWRLRGNVPQATG